MKKQFNDFVRKMEKEGKAGSYIVKFKHGIKNWFNFNDIIAGKCESLTLTNERLPCKDELFIILGKVCQRQVSISIMAFFTIHT